MEELKLKSGWQMTFAEFNKQYEMNMTQDRSYIEAYRITEDLHKYLTGATRYSGYDSFRKARQRKINK